MPEQVEAMRLLLNQTQAAHALGMTPRFLENRRHLGDGPSFIKLGNRIRYRMSDLEKWAEAHLHTSTSDTAK
jgi:predicted DNA-binding transcriptional regulator AlpA